MITVECKYLDNKVCTHKDKPFGDKPLPLRCLKKCMLYDGPSRGAGDTIAKFTQLTGIKKMTQVISNITGKPCDCQTRQEKLNNAVPYNNEDH